MLVTIEGEELPQTRVTVGLFWHSFQSSNLGVSALTDANMSLIVEAASPLAVDFVIFGPQGLGDFEAPAEFKSARHVAVSSFRRVRNVHTNIRHCDVVFDIGAGDSFADIYGWKRLTKIAGLKLLSFLAGRRPTLSPQTIGPFQTRTTRLVGMGALRVCKQVFARDQLSMDRASSLMGGTSLSKLSLSSDVAFELKRLSDWPEHFPELEVDQRHIGVNVSGLLSSGGYSQDNQFSLSLDYKALVEKLVDYVSRLPNTQVWLVPHVFHVDRVTPECDRAASLELQKMFPSVKMAPIFANAREAKTFIGSLDLVFAARMHAAIAAVSSGVACLPMSYSIKFQGLFESIDYPFILDLKSTNEDSALKQVMEACDSVELMSNFAKNAEKLALKALEPYKKALASEFSDLH